MQELHENLGLLLASYWTFAFGIAAAFYAALRWFGKHHLAPEAKETLALWLMGAYESSWSHHFCNLFDAVFGARHLSWRCFWRSSVASLLAVAVLYVLFAEILGVMGRGDTRAAGELPLWQAVLLGAAINVIPDYLSLFETRWLLQRFERVRSVAGQLAVLVADAVFTGLIIWLGINAFRLATGEGPVTIVEMLALFSVFALFFYSTFLTSVWAWLFCLSTWFMRLFSRTRLKDILDVEHKPVAQTALAGAALIFAAALLVTPGLRPSEQGKVTVFDDWLCRVFPKDACLHVSRLTADEERALAYLAKACEGGAIETCLDTASKYYQGEAIKAAILLDRACEGGVPLGCTILGYMYLVGHGVAQDDTEAVALYRRACDGGDKIGCKGLAFMYSKGRGETPDETEAAWRYRWACLNGAAFGCLNLAMMYDYGRGVARDNVKAVSLYRRACDLGRACFLIPKLEQELEAYLLH